MAKFISQTLQLSKDDVVLDFGSGPGFIARTLCDEVKKLYCVDLSDGFIAMCKEELKDTANTECHLIPYSDLSCVYEKGITAIYASAVFIHLNIYDVYIYLQEFHNVLGVGGRVWLDFKTSHNLSITDPNFVTHLKFYRTHRKQSTEMHYHSRLMNYYSFDAMENLASQVGFAVKSLRHIERPAGRSLSDHQVLLLTKL